MGSSIPAGSPNFWLGSGSPHWLASKQILLQGLMGFTQVLD